MATEEPAAERPDFGEVSRLRGVAFEYLSFGASILGIVALAVLLVYVMVDAFELTEASPEWLLTYFLTLVVPFIGFCLYSANERAVTRRAAALLGGGLVGIGVTFEAVELLFRPIPGLNWQLAYLFVVVVPVTAYAIYAGSRKPVGAAGLGVIARLYGGTIIGIAGGILFVVFRPQTWFLAYTLGVLPAAVVFGYGRLRPDSRASLLVVPVGVVGLVAAVVGGGLVGTYPPLFFIFLWSIGVPVAASVAALVLARGGSRRAAALTGAVPLVAGIAGLPVGEVGLPSGSAVIVFAVAAATTTAYVHRIVDAGEGRVGLLLPLLLAAGALAGAAIVGSFGFSGPVPWLNLDFLTTSPSQTPRDAGVYPQIIGSVVIIAMVAVLSFVLAVGTAVLLEEYASNSGFVGALTRFIQINISNLAAVPSIVYGLLGLGLFARTLGLGLGTGITAALTLSLLILPITVVSAQEAIRAVPDELRRGSDAIGATRWQTTKNVVLPEALPGIFTGVILSLGRAIGETAPLIMIGSATGVFSAPNSIFDTFSALPLQVYEWAERPVAGFRYGALAAGVVTLLIVLLSMNATAIILRNRAESDH